MPEKIIHILTGAVGTGKTSSLISWSDGRPGIFGILSPVVKGERIFMDISSRRSFRMLAEPGESNVLKVGRYLFSWSAFEEAIGIIRQAIHKQGWLVIDEIGPLELNKEGFYTVLKEVLENKDYPERILLVIRQELVESVKVFFQINDVVTITDISKLPAPGREK